MSDDFSLPLLSAAEISLFLTVCIKSYRIFQFALCRPRKLFLKDKNIKGNILKLEKRKCEK